MCGLVADDSIRKISFSQKDFLDAAGEVLVLQNVVAGRLTQVAVDQQDALLLLRQGQCKVDCNGGLAFVFQKTGDHNNLFSGHVPFNTVSEFADGFHIGKSRYGIIDENTGLFAPQQRC